MSDRDHPEMFERVQLEAWVNGYSENRTGEDKRPIVSLFIPDGSQGFHGPEGTTIWMMFEHYELLRKSQDAS